MKKQKKGSVSGKRRQRKSFLKPVRKTGIETKNPATAQMRVTAESLKNFLMLNTKRPKVKNKDTNMLKRGSLGVQREREETDVCGDFIATNRSRLEFDDEQVEAVMRRAAKRSWVAQTRQQHTSNVIAREQSARLTS